MFMPPPEAKRGATIFIILVTVAATTAVTIHRPPVPGTGVSQCLQASVSEPKAMETLPRVRARQTW